MIRVFDAFSGIGGFCSAFERVVGFKTVGWCEIDPKKNTLLKNGAG